MMRRSADYPDAFLGLERDVVGWSLHPAFGVLVFLYGMADGFLVGCRQWGGRGATTLEWRLSFRRRRYHSSERCRGAVSAEGAGAAERN